MATVDFTDNSRFFQNGKDAAIGRALEMIGLKAEGYAKAVCPVDTGRLRNSITHTQEGKDTEIVGSAVEYAPYVELGTRKMRAQPYLKPAVKDHITEYKKIAKQCLKGV